MKLLTVREAATFLRLQPGTVYKNKSIPRTKLPGIKAVLFDEDELIKWAKGLITPSPIEAHKPLHIRGVDKRQVTTYDNSRWLKTL